GAPLRRAKPEPAYSPGDVVRPASAVARWRAEDPSLTAPGAPLRPEDGRPGVCLSRYGQLRGAETLCLRLPFAGEGGRRRHSQPTSGPVSLACVVRRCGALPPERGAPPPRFLRSRPNQHDPASSRGATCRLTAEPARRNDSGGATWPARQP